MPDPDRELARVRTLARVMDGYLVDPLIGFVLPGIGDVIGSLIGFYVVFIALKRRASCPTSSSVWTRMRVERSSVSEMC